MEEISIEVTFSPLLLILPSIVGYSATVSEKNAKGVNIITGELTPQSSAFAIFFKKRGRVEVIATSPTVFQFYAIAFSKPCPMFTISTSNSEHFIAHRDGQNVNLTITNDQKFCIFHVSNAPTEISVNYSTDYSTDNLYFQNSDEDRNLTGDGTFFSISESFSSFIWIANSATLSKSFSIRFFSEDSTLPIRRGNYTAMSWSEISSSPEVIYDVSGSSAAKLPNSYFNADLDWFERPDDIIVVNLIVISIGTFFGLMVLILLVICCINWQRRRCIWNSKDEEQQEMLHSADIAGVQRPNEQCHTDEQSEDLEIMLIPV